VNEALERFAKDFTRGTVLFKEGQPGDYMYVVQAGEVEIRRSVGDMERVLAILSPGEFFGEMAILNGRPRSATAVVRTDARLLVIEGKTFEAMLRARPEIALRIIKALARTTTSSCCSCRRRTTRSCSACGGWPRSRWCSPAPRRRRTRRSSCRRSRKTSRRASGSPFTR
jgi:CRP-like cAMP-binding protein